jgi:hypothetical protein
VEADRATGIIAVIVLLAFALAMAGCADSQERVRAGGESEAH